MPDRPARVEIDVPVTTGDSYVERHGVGRVAYLKVDVEGMEMEVLEGFRGSLQRGAVAAVQFEHNWAHVLSRHLLGNFVDFFGSFGFEIFRIFPARLVKLDYNYRTGEVFTGNNYLAVARDRGAGRWGSTEICSSPGTDGPADDPPARLLVAR